jgi:hypothetical protein
MGENEKPPAKLVETYFAFYSLHIELYVNKWYN